MENDQNREYAPHCPEYILVTGNLAASILLAHLLSEPENPVCIADTALGMKTGLSLGQLRRARRVLEQLGFIRTEITRPGGRRTVRCHLDRARISGDLGRAREGLDRRPKKDGDF